MEISTSSLHHLTITLTISLFLHLCNSIDTITSTQFISDSKNESLISADGNFKLGFFNPNNSQNRYVGIWFNKIPQSTFVWVANRDAPLKNRGGVFKIRGDGNVGVFSGSGETEPPLWSTNVTVGITGSSTAKLLSSGTFLIIFLRMIVWASAHEEVLITNLSPTSKLELVRAKGLLFWKKKCYFNVKLSWLNWNIYTYYLSCCSLIFKK